MRYSSKTLAIGVMMAMVVVCLTLMAAGTQESKTVTGVVKSVDAANQSLQITEDVTNQEFTFKVETTTVITKGDKTVSLAEVKAGDKVEAVLDQGKMVALRVK